MLYFSVGMPRSGKSTIAKEWAGKFGPDDPRDVYMDSITSDTLCTKWWIDFTPRYGKVVVCGDDFRLATHGQVYRRLSECDVSAHVLTAIKALLLTGHTVFFDETNSSAWSIERIFEIDPDAIPVFIRTPKEVCIQRALDNKQDYLVPVIEKVAKNLEYMTPEKIEEIRKDVKSRS
jgi:tRNA uridine 5-carbamoylmethylation protein Kti12